MKRQPKNSENKFLQEETQSNFVDENTIGAKEIEAGEKKLHQQCDWHEQHNDIKRHHIKTLTTEKEKSCGELNEDKNIFKNCSDISQVIEKNQELSSTSKIDIEGNHI